MRGVCPFKLFALLSFQAGIHCDFLSGILRGTGLCQMSDCLVNAAVCKTSLVFIA